MRSSTSSSKQEIAHAGKTLVVFALTFVLGLLAVELTWRSRGLTPSVTDDKALWSAQRHRVYGKDVVVVLGKSRAQMGIDSTLLQSLSGRRVVFLPAHGTGAARTLLDLAEDKKFTGSVLFSMSEVDLTRMARDEQKEYVDHFRRDNSIDRRFGTRARAQIENGLVAVRRDLSLQHLLKYRFEKGVFPEPNFFRTYPSRDQEAHFEVADTAKMIERARALRQRQSQLAERYGGVNPRGWLREARELYPAFERLRARGGEVILLKFAACEEAEAFWTRWYPRAQFWDALAAEVPAKTLHYQDIEGLGVLECPDSSHVGAASREHITRSLYRALMAL